MAETAGVAALAPECVVSTMREWQVEESWQATR